MDKIMSKYYFDDLKKISQTIEYIEKLRNKSFFITGCNGLICSALIDLLIILNDSEELNIQIYLATRNIEKTKNRFPINEKKYLKLFEYDAIRDFSISDKVDFFIHGASNSNPSLYYYSPIETMNGNIIGISNILRQAKKINSRVLYISSSEVYGLLDKQNEPIKENQYGYIDFLNPRSSYAMAKRTSESLCAFYSSEYNVDTVIVRPGHIYGPTALSSDNRVASQFLFDVLESKQIVLKSKGEQIRSYTHCFDCATAILCVLINGNSGEAYNISNSSSIVSIREMANEFARQGNVKLKFEIKENTGNKLFNPMNNSSLDSTKLESLGWKGFYDLRLGIMNTIKSKQM